MYRSVCALALLMASVACGADRLVIVPSEGGECRLLLPRDILMRYDSTPMKRQSLGAPTLPTIVAGLALTVAVVLAGLMLVRKANPRLVAGTCACVAAGLMFINSSCSPHPAPIRDDYRLKEPTEKRRGGISYRATTPLTVNEAGVLSGEVLLEEGALGDAPRLVIDGETLQKLKEKP